MIRQKNSNRLLSTNTTNSTTTTTATTNDNLRVENHNLPQAPNFNNNFQPQPEGYGYRPVILVSSDSQQHPSLKYNPAQPYYINDQQPILQGDDPMLGSSAPGTSSSSSNFIANRPSSLHSSPNSDSPNHLNQIVSNYIPMSIPNEDQSVTPPDIFQNVPQDKIQYYVEIPSTTDDLKAALYKDTIRRISHVRNDFDLPTFSSDSSYDNQTEYNPASEQQQQQQQQQQLQQQMPPPMTQPSNFNNGYQDVDAALGAPFISHADFDVGYESQSSDDFSHTRAVFAEHFGIVIPKSKEAEQQNIAPPPHQAKIGDALPNAIRSPVSLRMLQYPKTYLNTSIEEYFRDNRELLEKTLLSPKSIWTKQDDKLIWTSIFSGVIGRPFPNFAFFIDRGLNVILKVCNRSLASVTSDTCFTKETFDVLVKRSYSSYGGLIKNLRESIGLYIESSTILSWLSSWSLFIHSNSTAKVSNLILTGSTSLLRNCLNDYQKISDVHPTIAFIIRAIRVNTFCAAAPDYKFDIIEQIYHDVVQYKKFVIYNQDLTTKNNGYILKSFVDLENFLHDLINNRYPRIKQLDEAYKRKNNFPPGGDNIEFISPDDIFSVIVDWLSIVPSHAMSVGKSMTPLKKNYYLFFIAISVALSSIFPYMRSVFLVDPWNVIFPRTDFDNELYKFTSADVGRADQFEYLSQLSKKLLRTINFFLNRRLLIYSVINQTNVLQPGETYLEKCDSIDGYPNVVHLKPAKVKFNEVPLPDFSINNIINAYNYPMVDFKSEKYKQFKGVFSTETHDQKVRIKELRAKFENTDKETTNGSLVPKDDFDYNIGMFAYDFNVKPLLDEITSVLTELKPNTIEEIKQELENFENSQKEVGKCV
ncbi:hypothetical protein Cantr_04505 [Candida viswanathii]|uniref:Uncharacterized protein n=1 Tax=Candida viswanathii TaxID=5486 RepID=A0A367XNN3_9ASCO|nr:hypothetical protein Cantr_04505 [Candida viswanathii]